MFSSPITPSENYDEFRNLLQNEIFWFEMLEVSSFKFSACCSWESKLLGKENYHKSRQIGRAHV